MLTLSDRILVKEVRNDYLCLCYNIMHIIKNEHEAVLCNCNLQDPNLEDIYERNYIITFAYLMGQKSKERKYANNLLSDKFVNGEVNKQIFLNPDDPAYEDRNRLKSGREYFCPDFVIHTSHSNSGSNYEGQCLIMEAKTTSNLKQDDFNWDLFKLNLYVEKLDFDTAVYLIVNTTLSDVKKMIRNYTYWHSDKLEIPNQKNRVPHIYFLIQEKVDEMPKIYELIIERTL